jgi:fanconi anemia group J protein
MCIAHDPHGQVIKATFASSNQSKFQDGVGQTLLQLAAVVPDGLLVFMPSYGMMDKLAQRWRDTGVHKVKLLGCL